MSALADKISGILADLREAIEVEQWAEPKFVQEFDGAAEIILAAVVGQPCPHCGFLPCGAKIEILSHEEMAGDFARLGLKNPFEKP